MGEVLNSAPFGPNKKLGDGLRVCRSGVFVSNVGREEFDEAPSGAIAGANDRSGQLLETGSKNFAAMWSWKESGVHRG